MPDERVGPVRSCSWWHWNTHCLIQAHPQLSWSPLALLHWPKWLAIDFLYTLNPFTGWFFPAEGAGGERERGTILQRWPSNRLKRGTFLQPSQRWMSFWLVWFRDTSLVNQYVVGGGKKSLAKWRAYRNFGDFYLWGSCISYQDVLYLWKNLIEIDIGTWSLLNTHKRQQIQDSFISRERFRHLSRPHIVSTRLIEIIFKIRLCWSLLIY